ncbi:MAG TPA: T9SS type A sorting domain-containing protein [Nitrosomonas sp.]|nr:T9SS type A sorting domain-containing protein [Nitrosomonas sp.]
MHKTPPPPLTLGGISGPSELMFKQQGTWTVTPTGGSGNYGYQWYFSDDGGSSWTAYGTTQSVTRGMNFYDFVMRCDVHDNVTGENVSAQKVIYYGLAKHGMTDHGMTAAANEIPKEFLLRQSHPNPFNPTTTIAYGLPEAGFISIKVYNTLGDEIATLVNDFRSAGYYTLNWNAGNFPSGVYFYRIQAGNFTATKKMLLTK